MRILYSTPLGPKFSMNNSSASDISSQPRPLSEKCTAGPKSEYRGAPESGLFVHVIPACRRTQASPKNRMNPSAASRFSGEINAARSRKRFCAASKICNVNGGFHHGSVYAATPGTVSDRNFRMADSMRSGATQSRYASVAASNSISKPIWSSSTGEAFPSCELSRIAVSSTTVSRRYVSPGKRCAKAGCRIIARHTAARMASVAADQLRRWRRQRRRCNGGCFRLAPIPGPQSSTLRNAGGGRAFGRSGARRVRPARVKLCRARRGEVRLGRVAWGAFRERFSLAWTLLWCTEFGGSGEGWRAGSVGHTDGVPSAQPSPFWVPRHWRVSPVAQKGTHFRAGRSGWFRCG